MTSAGDDLISEKIRSLIFRYIRILLYFGTLFIDFLFIIGGRENVKHKSFDEKRLISFRFSEVSVRKKSFE